MNIFISFPYTHNDKAVTYFRVFKAREYFNKLISEGHTPFAPAIVGHDLIHQLGLNGEEQDMSFNKWESFCYDYMQPCSEIHILQLDGWVKSEGVGGEILKAAELGVKVKYIDL